MLRYKSSTKFNNEKNIVFQEDFDQESRQNILKKQPQPNPQYQSIPNPHIRPKQIRLSDEDQDQERPKNAPPIDQIVVLTKTDSKEKIQMNNFFGSRKLLQRKIIPSPEQTYNPQMRQRRQMNVEEDTNDKLQKMIQKQIEDRQKWQRLTARIIYQPPLTPGSQRQDEKLIDQSETNQRSEDNNYLKPMEDSETVKRINSINKLTKVTEKFQSLNIQKNTHFQNKHEDHEYLNPALFPKQVQNKEDLFDPSPILKQKKKRSVSQLKPLNKKNSTYEVLNQLEMPTKLQSPLIQNNQSTVSQKLPPIPVSKPVPTTTTTSTNFARKTLNLSRTRIIGIDIKDLLRFNILPLPKGKYIEGIIHRDKSGLDNTFFPEYRLQFDDIRIISAKKTMKGYDIYFQGQQSLSRKIKIGSVKGNILGSYYNIYEGEDQAKIIATVFYASQLTTKSPTREVEFYIRSQEINQHQEQFDQMYQASTDLKTLHQRGLNNLKIIKYINKQPVYDSITNSYTLDFGGKITMLSVKNVILINQQNSKQKGIIFGKCGYDKFYLRAESPLSPLMIMGYLMSSFNFKWVTQ